MIFLRVPSPLPISGCLLSAFKLVVFLVLFFLRFSIKPANGTEPALIKNTEKAVLLSKPGEHRKGISTTAARWEVPGNLEASLTPH